MKPGECKHFTGIGKDTCRAHVVYTDLIGSRNAGWACRLPCVTSSLTKNPVSCEKFEALTQEEYDEKMAKWKERLGQTFIAREIITSQPDFKVGSSGSVECPVCKSKLNYSCALNGHIHAICETKECLSWME